MTPVLQILAADVTGPHRLRLLFSTGEMRTVDARPLIERVGGPVFAPLLDAGYFARVTVDPVCGTVVWPNGADIAPDALYELSKEGKRGRSGREAA
jgi:hypothetical protein